MLKDLLKDLGLDSYEDLKNYMEENPEDEIVKQLKRALDTYKDNA